MLQHHCYNNLATLFMLQYLAEKISSEPCSLHADRMEPVRFTADSLQPVCTSYNCYNNYCCYSDSCINSILSYTSILEFQIGLDTSQENHKSLKKKKNLVLFSQICETTSYFLNFPSCILEINM